MVAPHPNAILEALSRIILEFKVTPHGYQKLFQDCFSHIVSRYVGQEPASPSNWWNLPPRGCGCKECKEQLDPFLGGDRERFEYTGSHAKREHLKMRVTMESSIRTSTRKKTWGVHTLILAKSRGEYYQMLAAWGKRSREFKNMFGRMDKVLMKEFLPEEATVGGDSTKHTRTASGERGAEAELYCLIDDLAA